MAAFTLAVFTVSVGFGVALPRLPYLIERLLGAAVAAAQVSRHGPTARGQTRLMMEAQRLFDLNLDLKN